MAKDLRPGYYVAQLIDAPAVFDCSSTPVPGNASLPTQVVSSLVETIQKITVFDATNRYIGLYKGDPGAEVIVCIIGGGVPFSQEVTIEKGARVSVRNMDADAIILRSFTIQFMAQIY